MEERASYQSDQDKDLMLLHFDNMLRTPRGFLSFFAVHGTSLYGVYLMLLYVQGNIVDLLPEQQTSQQ